MDTIAVPRFTAFTPAACLLHADFHPMTSECWGATLDWHLAHEHLGQAAARDAYHAAVEREMLDRHARSSAATADTRHQAPSSKPGFEPRAALRDGPPSITP